jgi:formiminoglutamate deiminase
MTVYWAEHAMLPDGIAHGVRIDSIDGRISAVEVDVAPTGTVLPGLTLPGFANGHSHAFHRALRGTTHADGGTFWNWRERMYEVASSLTPDSYRELATAVFAEMVLAGYTVVGEFHYVHGQPDGAPYGVVGEMEQAVLAAAAAAGIRITLLDTVYLEGGVGRDLEPRQLRFSDGSVDAWAARRASLASSPTALIGAALHSVRAVTPQAIAEFARLDLPVVHAHVSEQPIENGDAIAQWGATPVDLLAAVLGPRFTAVHATHLVRADIDALGGSFACFCPTTERDLADGIGPARALADAGTRLTLGSDQNAVVDPFEELRGLEMNERLASGSRGRFSPAELLAAATDNGYASLGWSGISIRAGELCDLVALDVASVRTAGSALEQSFIAANSSDVTHVIVNGELIVENREHRLGDVAALLSSSIERTRA